MTTSSKTYGIEIRYARNIGSIYPFIVTCLDNDLRTELHKTPATTTAAGYSSFNAAFTLTIRQQGTYLTFFIYDTGRVGIPLLGSAGVLLNTVTKYGFSHGEFPVVNGGKGFLSLIVRSIRGTRLRTNTPHDNTHDRIWSGNIQHPHSGRDFAVARNENRNDSHIQNDDEIVDEIDVTGNDRDNLLFREDDHFREDNPTFQAGRTMVQSVREYEKKLVDPLQLLRQFYDV